MGHLGLVQIDLTAAVAPSADHRAGLLWIHAVHEDVEFTAAMRAAIAREILGLVRWLELEITGEGSTLNRRSG